MWISNFNIANPLLLTFQTCFTSKLSQTFCLNAYWIHRDQEQSKVYCHPALLQWALTADSFPFLVVLVEVWKLPEVIGSMMYCWASQWSKSSWEHQHCSFTVCLLVSINPSFYYLCFHHANQRLDCPRNKLPDKSLFGNIAPSLTEHYFLWHLMHTVQYHYPRHCRNSPDFYMMSWHRKRVTLPLESATQQCNVQVNRTVFAERRAN